MKKEELSKEMVGYIEGQLRQGYSLDQIRSKLLESGHPYEYVGHHVNHFRRKRIFRKVLIIAAIIIIFVAAYLALNNPNANDSHLGEDTPENQITLQAALANDDIKMCKELLDPRDTKACELEITGRVKLTGNSATDAFNKEIIGNATRDSDAKLCYKISNLGAKTNCLDLVYIGLLKDNVINEVKCGILTGTAAKEKCIGYSIFNNVMKTKDTEDCEKIIIPIGLRELCRTVR